MSGFRERLQTAKASNGGSDAAARGELFAGASGGAWGDQASALDQRARLLRNTDRMERSTEALASSERLSHETEALGHEILGQLGQQRETIMNTRSNLGNVNDNLGRSRRVVAAMQRRTVTNKVITACVILGLIGVSPPGVACAVFATDSFLSLYPSAGHCANHLRVVCGYELGVRAGSLRPPLPRGCTGG